MGTTRGETSALTAAEVRRVRMRSLLLAEAAPREPWDVATWFGAMQAQDAASGHWSLGVRCEGLTETDVLAAFERGDIVRTWPMRSTIHIVPGRDVAWMLELTGVRALSGARKRREQLGLSDADATGAAAALDAAMRGGVVLTRAEALAVIADAGIDTSGQRGYHLLWFAAQSGVTVIGPQRGTDQTFVRLADWAPNQVVFTREEALAELFHRFVRSHGPVPLKDFAGWTGLTMADSKAAAAANDGRVVPVDTEAGPMWATLDLVEALPDLSAPPVVALPGFDEFVLGYKDRSLQLPPDGIQRVVPGGNGVFRATIAVEGKAVATWRRTMRAARIDIEIEPFEPPLSARLRKAAEAALARYGKFLGMPVRVGKAE